MEQPYPSVGGILLANGVVYHGSTDGTMHAMDATTGDELWTEQVGTGMASGPSVANGVLLVGHGFSFFAAQADSEGGIVAYAP